MSKNQNSKFEYEEETEEEALKRARKTLIIQHIIIVLLIFAVLILLFIIISKLGSEADMCLRNPMVFGAKKLQEVNKDEIICRCDLLSQLPAPTLWFNKDNYWFEQPEISENLIETERTNWSAFNWSTGVTN